MQIKLGRKNIDETCIRLYCAYVFHEYNIYYNITIYILNTPPNDNDAVKTIYFFLF